MTTSTTTATADKAYPVILFQADPTEPSGIGQGVKNVTKSIKPVFTLSKTEAVRGREAGVLMYSMTLLGAAVGRMVALKEAESANARGKQQHFFKEKDVHVSVQDGGITIKPSDEPFVDINGDGLDDLAELFAPKDGVTL